MPETIYRATKTRSNRPGWSAIFRHPRRTDTLGKYGLRIRRGLGTDDAAEADKLIEQLNILLASEQWWSADRRAEAVLRFEEVVVAMFFEGIEVGEYDFADLREQHIQLPSHDDGYARILFVGDYRGRQDNFVASYYRLGPPKRPFPLNIHCSYHYGRHGDNNWRRPI